MIAPGNVYGVDVGAGVLDGKIVAVGTGVFPGVLVGAGVAVNAGVLLGKMVAVGTGVGNVPPELLRIIRESRMICPDVSVIVRSCPGVT